jgi:hypothetical protein
MSRVSDPPKLPPVPGADLPVLRIAQADFEVLPDYSATLPTGTTTGKRWKRLDGSFDRDFLALGGQPHWLIGEYGAPSADGKSIRVNWYRPVVVVQAATKPFGEAAQWSS